MTDSKFRTFYISLTDKCLNRPIWHNAASKNGPKSKKRSWLNIAIAFCCLNSGYTYCIKHNGSHPPGTEITREYLVYIRGYIFPDDNQHIELEHRLLFLYYRMKMIWINSWAKIWECYFNFLNGVLINNMKNDEKSVSFTFGGFKPVKTYYLISHLTWCLKHKYALSRIQD